MKASIRSMSVLRLLGRGLFGGVAGVGLGVGLGVGVGDEPSSGFAAETETGADVAGVEVVEVTVS